jgi:hypothetical protein
LFSTHLLFSLILLSPTNPTSGQSLSLDSLRELVSTAIREATDFIDHSQSIEKGNGRSLQRSPIPQLPPRSHLTLMLVQGDENPTQLRTRSTVESTAKMLLSQPLLYSFYVQNVLQPYRSRLAEANSSSTSFCSLDKAVQQAAEGPPYRDSAVCFPNSDARTEGVCISCGPDLKAELEKGRLNDGDNIAALMAMHLPAEELSWSKANPWKKYAGGFISTVVEMDPGVQLRLPGEEGR